MKTYFVADMTFAGPAFEPTAQYIARSFRPGDDVVLFDDNCWFMNVRENPTKNDLMQTANRWSNRSYFPHIEYALHRVAGTYRRGFEGKFAANPYAVLLVSGGPYMHPSQFKIVMDPAPTFALHVHVGYLHMGSFRDCPRRIWDAAREESRKTENVK